MRIYDSVVNNNVAFYSGGGVYAYASTVEFNRVTVRWNRQTVASLIHGGGGIAGENGASIDIRESVLTSNHAATNGNQIYVSASAQQGASITLVNTRLPP